MLALLARWAFRAAMAAFPKDVRRGMGDEACAVFELELERRRGLTGLEGPWAYAIRATVNAAKEGTRERIRRGPLPGHGAFPSEIKRRKTMWGGWGSDLKFAVRALVRSPGLAVSAIVVLALGLGANATVFSALKSTVLAPLPYPDAQTLVMADLTVTQASSGEIRTMPWSYPKFRILSETGNRLLDPVAAYGGRSATISAPGDAAQIHVEVVTPDYFRVLGLDMARGRGFGPSEDDPANPPLVAVISHEMWQTRFGADPSAVGRDATLNGRPVTIIGVTPPGFDGLTGGASAWLPVLASEALFNRFMVRGAQAHWMRAIGRRGPDTSMEAVTAQMEVVAAGLAAAYPTDDPGREYSASARALSDVRVNGRAHSAVWLLTAAALLVLLVACANLSGLLLARSRRRNRDGAVRLAVGASRWRVIRGSLVESLLLAAAGGTLGIILATWGSGALALLWPREFLSSADHELRAMSPESIAVDGQVLLFSALATVAAAVAVGLWPALRTSSVNLAAALKDGGMGERSRRSSLDARSVLIATQVGLALVLVVGTGLVGSSIARMLGEDRGFGAENVLAFRYDLPASSALAEHPADFHDQLRERVLRLPSVESVTTGCPPLRGHCWGITRVDAIEGREPIPRGEGPEIGITLVGDSYFETLDVTLLAGRPLGADDGLDSQPTAVINQRAAQLLFPDEDPIGKRVQVGVSEEGKDPFVEVVGVVANVMYNTPDQDQYPELYYSYREFPDRGVWMLVRTNSDPTAVAPLVRGELSQMAPDVAMAGVTTIEDIVDGSVGDRRVLFGLLIVFAALTLALSATGTWGVVANAVVERRKELGLRLALGAAHGGVVGLVLRTVLGAAAAGIVGGALVALAGSRALAAFLYDTSRTDPVAYALAAVLLLAVVALAAWLPAKRATRVDPVEALRAE